MSPITAITGGLNGKESICQYRKCKETQVQSLGWDDPGIGNGNPLWDSCLKSHEQRSLVDYIHVATKGQI